MMSSIPRQSESPFRHHTAALHRVPLALAAATLLLAFLAGPAAAQTTTCLKEPCPRPDTELSQGTFGTQRISPAGRELPLRLAGTSGGPADAPDGDDAPGCAGFLGVHPDHVLTFSRDMAELRVEVRSRGATLLALHGPDGWVCSDGGGQNDQPALQGTFTAGTWRIWVASADMGAYHNYTLEVGPAPVVQEPSPRPRPDRTRPDRVRPIPPPAPPVVEEREPRHRPRPDRHRPEPAPAPTFVVRGQFEDIDVRFEAATIAEVHQQCTAFLGQARNLTLVDDVVFHGRAWRNVSGFWSHEALCAMVALNARPQGASAEHALARGNLEGVPFEIHGSPDDLRAILNQYLPVAVDMTWADDLEVNGQTRRNRTGYWNLEEVIMLILSLSDA
ncbi:MAG: hypothetical protein EA398_15595 [Deltaproteobacteria bacterium]|nr:MAG: hypothetical protein EA398_15595 [Deltaproteobacteria bacterium]